MYGIHMDNLAARRTAQRRGLNYCRSPIEMNAARKFGFRATASKCEASFRTG
jgi:hypothetical protein